MVGRLFAQDPQLYAGCYYVIGKQPGADTSATTSVSAKRSACWSRAISRAFIDSFRKVEHWFGDYAPAFPEREPHAAASGER